MGGDLAVLRAIDARLVDAALTAIEDLTFGRQVGKLSPDPPIGLSDGRS